MSDWLNPWLDKLKAWAALEWLVSRVFGVHPKAETEGDVKADRARLAAERND